MYKGKDCDEADIYSDFSVLKFILILGIIVTPFYAIIWRHEYPLLHGIMLYGFAYSALFIVIFAITILSSTFRKHSYIISCIIIISTSIFLFIYTLKNNFTYGHSMLLLLVVSSATLIFKRPVHLLIYQSIMLLIISGGLIIRRSNTDTPIFVFIATLFLFSVFTYAVNLYRYKLLEKMNRLAYYDSLTGLAGRKLLEEKIRNRLNGKLRHIPFTLLFIDFNNFKSLNDTYGHATGDDVLKQIASRLKNVIKKDDIAARLGGDEFVILLSSDSTREEAANAAQNIHTKLTQPFYAGEKDIVIIPSIGISMYPYDGATPEVLVSNADKAMYNLKKNKDCGFRFYSEYLP